MDSFALVDLVAQRDDVAEYVKGWELREVIDWMCQFGTITEKRSPAGFKIYLFKTESGMKSGFYISPTGRFTVVSGGWLPY